MAALLALAPAVVGLGRPADAAAIQIMPLGDSITYGYSDPAPVPGGYRGILYQDLTSAGYDVQMVGSQTTNPDPSLPAAADSHEGHIGWLIAGDGAYSGFAVGAHIDDWLAPGNGVNPSLILLMLGTNEMVGSYHVEQAPYDLAALINQIAELRPGATILVSTIPPLADAAREAQVQVYNAALVGIVAQLQQEGIKIELVDAGGSVSPSNLSPDGVHPDAAGYDQIAAGWLPAVEAALGPPGGGLGNAFAAPEPSTVVLLAAGSLGLLALRHRRDPRGWREPGPAPGCRSPSGGIGARRPFDDFRPCRWRVPEG